MIVEISRVVTGDPWRIHDDELTSDGLISSPRRHDSLNDQDAFSLRLDTQRENLLQADRRHSPARQHDSMLLWSFHHRSQTLIAVSPTSMADLCLRITAVRNHANTTLDRHRATVFIIRLTSDFDFNVPPHAIL